MGPVYHRDFFHIGRCLIIHRTPIGVCRDDVLSFMESVHQKGLSHAGGRLDIHKTIFAVGGGQSLPFNLVIDALIFG